MTAIQRVAEEESARMVDKAYSEFVAELMREFAAEKLPISQEALERQFTTLQRKHRGQLRRNLADLLTFE